MCCDVLNHITDDLFGLRRYPTRYCVAVHISHHTEDCFDEAYLPDLDVAPDAIEEHVRLLLYSYVNALQITLDKIQAQRMITVEGSDDIVARPHLRQGE